ncbi:MAG: hypothetical protein P8Z00_08910 [Anaerolineales bacterium]
MNDPQWVECHSGSTYAERPAAFYWQGQRLEVESILARWRTPTARCFRVLTRGQRIFELQYDESADTWHIQPA